MSVSELRKNAMMAHLIDALSRGEDVGHYGRLVFVMVARHFLSEEELFKLLQLDPSLDEEKVRALIEPVATKGYSPPKPGEGN
jgi:DNA primase large subunit